VDYRRHNKKHISSQWAKRDNALFAIVEAIIDPFDGRSVENSRCILEGDSMPANVGDVLVRVPGEPNDDGLYVMYLRRVAGATGYFSDIIMFATGRTMRRGAKRPAAASMRLSRPVTTTLRPATSPR